MQKKFRSAFLFGIGFTCCAVLVQGGIDFFVWGRPFAEFQEYVAYNIKYAGDYGGIPWINYIWLILGIILPPISFFIVFGFIRSFRKYLLLTLPTTVFLIFHFYFQNRQERFILPAVPFILVAGVMGWEKFREQSSFWKQKTKLLKGSVVFAVVLNSILIFPISLHYSHRDRVEAMTFLSKQGDLRSYLVEDSNRDNSIMFPRFYLGRWDTHEFHISIETNAAEYGKELQNLPDNIKPNYVMFLQEDYLDQRIAKLKNIYPNLEYVTTIDPSFIDVLLHRINYRNRNQICFIYKIK